MTQYERESITLATTRELMSILCTFHELSHAYIQAIRAELIVRGVFK